MRPGYSTYIMAEHALKLTGEVITRDDRDQLYDDLAMMMAAAAARATGKRDVFHLALTGGPTLEPFYVHLVIDPRYRHIPWRQTHIWIVDEHRVAEDDERCNLKKIRESLVDQLPIPSRQVHAMPVFEDDPAAAYERLLEEHISDGRLDFVLLSMGEDTHWAGLFPQPKAQEQVGRATMNLLRLNAARELAILVTGSDKSQTLQQIDDQLQQSGPDAEHLPVWGLAPTDGDLYWYLDAAAAGLQIEME